MRQLLGLCLVLVLGLVLGLTGCGAESSTSARPAWSEQAIAGAVGPDSSPGLAVSGNDVVLLLMSEQGRAQSFLSRGGRPFVAGTPVATGLPYGDLTAPVRLADDSWLALGSGGEDFRPVALRSTDGLTWTAARPEGLTGPVDVSGVVATDDGVLVVGSHRRDADASTGGFEAAAWRTTDGRRYVETELPGVPAHRPDGDDSWVSAVAAVGDGLLAVGRTRGEAAAWRSTDGGAHWTGSFQGIPRASYGLTGLVADGDRVLAASDAGAHRTLLSEDGGRTWRPGSGLARSDGEEDTGAPLWQAGRRVVAVQGSERVRWSSPEVCYADLAQCGQAPPAALVATADGEHWTRFDAPGSGPVDAVTGTADGRVLVLRRTEGGVSVATWPGGAPLPPSPEPAAPRTVHLVTLPEGKKPVVGVRYAYPLHTHCGVSRTWFGGVPWQRTDGGPGYETGAGDDPIAGWPIPPGGGSVYGYATLGADGVLTYTDADGTVLATYERAAKGFLCD